MEQGFGGDRRLRQRSEFDRVFKGGRRLGGPLFTLIALPTERRDHRLGLAVGRRLGSAVGRNRARRLLREAFRRLRPGTAGAYDLVVVAHPGIVGWTQAEVEGEFKKRLQRLGAGSGRGRSSPSAAD